MAHVLLRHIRDQRVGIREVLLQETISLGLGAHLVETGVGCLGTGVVRHEERTCEAAVLIGQAHEHVVAARPDVQALRVHQRAAVRPGGEGDLFVIVLDVFLAVVEAAVLHLGPHRAERAVAAQHHVGLHGLRLLPFPAEGAICVIQVHVIAAIAEMQRNARYPLRFGQQAVVQFPTAH